MSKFIVYANAGVTTAGELIREDRFEAEYIHDAMDMLAQNPQWDGISITFSSGKTIEGNLAFWQKRVKRILHDGRPTDYVAFYYEMLHSENAEPVEEGERNRRIEYTNPDLNKVLMFCASRPDLECWIFQEKHHPDGKVERRVGPPAGWMKDMIRDEGFLPVETLAAETQQDAWILHTFMRDDVSREMFQQAILNYAFALQRALKKKAS